MLPALIIYGTRSSPCRTEEGSFVCPCCNMQRTFHLMTMKRWFTLYFLPVLPIGSSGEYVECRSCGGTYGVEVLSMGPNLSYATRWPNKQVDPSLIVFGVVAGILFIPMCLTMMVGMFRASMRDKPQVASIQPATIVNQPDLRANDDLRVGTERFQAIRDAQLRASSEPRQPLEFERDPTTITPSSGIGFGVPATAPPAKLVTPPAQQPAASLPRNVITVTNKPIEPAPAKVPFLEENSDAPENGDDTPEADAPKSGDADTPKTDAASAGAVDPGTPEADKRPFAKVRSLGDNQVGEIQRYPEMGWSIKSLVFSPNGRYLVAGKQDRTILIFDLSTAAQIHSINRLEALGQVESVAFSPDGRTLLAGGNSGRIETWKLSDQGDLEPAAAFFGHIKGVKHIQVSPDGKYVLSGDADKKVCYWELATGRELFVVAGWDGPVSGTCITPDGKQGLASDGKTLHLIDLSNGSVSKSMQLTRSYHVQTMVCESDMVVVSDSYKLRCWDLKTSQELPPLDAGEIQWHGCFTPSGKFFLSGGRGKVTVWQLDNQRKVYEFDMAGTGYVQALACSPDGSHVAAIPSSAGQTLQVFRLPEHID